MSIATRANLSGQHHQEMRHMSRCLDLSWMWSHRCVESSRDTGAFKHRTTSGHMKGWNSWIDACSTGLRCPLQWQGSECCEPWGEGATNMLHIAHIAQWEPSRQCMSAWVPTCGHMSHGMLRTAQIGRCHISISVSETFRNLFGTSEFLKISQKISKELVIKKRVLRATQNFSKFLSSSQLFSAVLSSSWGMHGTCSHLSAKFRT